MRLSISLLLAVSSMSAIANPSFNCDNAKHAVELTICGNPALSKLDGDIARVYELLLAGDTDNQTELRQEQRQWLREIRNECADADCLSHVMTERMSQLSSAMADNPAQTEEKDEAPQPLPAAQASPTVETTLEESPPANAQELTAIEPVVQKTEETGFSLEMSFGLGLGIVAAMAVTAMGFSSYARYFVNWLDFGVTLGLIFVTATYVKDDTLLLVAVVLANFLIGLVINGFNLAKGIVATIGRCTAIFTLIALALACLVFIYTQMRTNSVDQRVGNGEDIRQAIMNDKIDHRRQAMSVAGSLGAIGAVLFWIKTYFIGNAGRVSETT